MGHVRRNFLAGKMILLLTLLIAISVSVLASCGGGGAAENVENTGAAAEQRATTASSAMEATTPPASEVLFPKQKPADGLPMSARIRGELVLDEEGCIRIDSGGGMANYLPLWPSYFELSAEGGELRILDGEGDFVARIGGRIDTGGGEMLHGETTPREIFQALRRGLGEDMAREVRERCPGPYWLVGPGEDHIQR